MAKTYSQIKNNFSRGLTIPATKSAVNFMMQREKLEVKTEESRAELICSKAYKTVMGKAFSDYQFRVENDLRNTADSEPRELWRILNNLSRSKQKDCVISINDLYEYFRDLNIDNDKSEDDNFELPDCNNDVVNDILNCEISEDEQLIIAVKNLKNNKAPGFDHIVNEYIKSTSTLLLPLYKKLFNMILDSIIIPQIWTVGIIMPIYKNKGDPMNPDSYRGITLVSSLGKLFTSILNSRLHRFAGYADIIPKTQAGFRKGYNTLDNIFVLHVLIDLYLHRNKKLFCTFIDFRKAFDTVWRMGLWKKLADSNITGKILRVIHNMYGSIKSCVKKEDDISGLFSCEIGVRQGENLSPFLFSIFLSDLESFFSARTILQVSNQSQRRLSKV